MANKTLIRNMAFLLLTAVQIAICIHYGHYKTDLFVDEIWSFNLANAAHHDVLLGNNIVNYMNRWLDAADFSQYMLSVQPETAFHYGDVFANQAQDVHPPLYYILLHTICSFFPQQFSPWFGIVLNVIFFAGTQVVLLKTADMLFGDKWMALLSCVLYGFSWGAINTVLFIRMYMMLTFFCLCAAYVHVLLWNDYHCCGRLRTKYLIALVAVTFGGFLTQYYYLIFAFFLSAAFSSYLLYRSRSHSLFFRYAAAAVGGILAGIALFPAALQHIFSGYRGMEAFKNLAQTEFGERFAAYVHMFNQDTAGGLLTLVVILFILYCILKVAAMFMRVSVTEEDAGYIADIEFTKPEQKIKACYQFSLSYDKLIFGLLAAAVICTFFVIVKISPFLTARYIYMLYPFAVMMVLRLCLAWFRCFAGPRLTVAMILLLTVVFCVTMYNSEKLYVSFAWKTAKQINRSLTAYSDINEILILGESKWMANSQLLTARRAKKLMIIEEKQAAKIKDIVKEYQKTHDAIVVYIADGTVKKKEDILQHITKESVYKKYQEIGKNTGKTYLLTKT